MEATTLGCQAPGGIDTSPQGAPTDPEAAFYRGDYARAARAWEARAETTDPARAGSLWISAADAWALAERPDAARDALRRLDRTTLLASDRSRLELVLADIALQEGREDEADVLLRQAEASLPSASRARYEDLYARLFEQLTGPGSRELGEATEIGAAMQYYDPNATVRIMRLLEDVTLSGNGAAVLAVSRSGDLVYTTGPLLGTGFEPRRLVRIDRSGGAQPLPFELP